MNNNPLTRSEVENLVKKNEDELLASISKSLTVPEVAKKDRKWLKIPSISENKAQWIVIAFGFFIIAIGLVVSFKIKNPASGLEISKIVMIASIVGGILVMLIGSVISSYVSSSHKDFNARFKFDQAGVYKRFLDAHFQSITVENFSSGEDFNKSIDIDIYKRSGKPHNTGEEVKEFAKVLGLLALFLITDGEFVPTNDTDSESEKLKAFTQGASGKINDMDYASIMKKIKPTALEKEGNDAKKTRGYYFYVKVSGLAKRFENLDLELKLGSSLDVKSMKNQKLFENEYLNQIMSITTNDNIATKRLITPYTQEQLVRLYKDYPREITIRIKKGAMVFSTPVLEKLFDYEFMPDKNKEKVAKSILSDLQPDIITFISLMSYVMIFKLLKTG